MRRGACVLSLATLACVGAAMAQQAPSAGNDEDNAQAAAIALDEITVIASKTGQSLKDTAASTVVLDARTLGQRGIGSSREVLQHIPNVSSTGPGNLAPAVRGVDGTGSAQGADAFFAGSRARLSVQVDGRPVSYNEVVFGNASLWDVQQVEMLRGPHSTLQGRNAIAGTLVIKTRDPTWTPEAAIRLVAGNQAYGQAAFYLSGPVSDEVALRLSADYQMHSSVLYFEPYEGMDDPRQFAVFTVRGKLLYEPVALPGLRQLVTLQHADARGPQTATQARPYGQHQPQFPKMPVFEPESDALVSDTRWHFADRLTFENLLSATDLSVRRYAQPHTGIVHLNARQYMLEPRLRLDQGDGALSGVVGVHVYRSFQNESIDFPAVEHFRDRVDTEAVFGEGVLALGERFDLTFGLRYERERHRRHGGDGALAAIALDETDTVWLPKLGLAWHPNPQWTLGVFTARGYNGGGGGITFNFPIVNYSYAPEHVRNYEAYFRADLADGRVEWTGNVFYGDYRDMQLPFDLNPDPAVWSVVVRNADRAHNVGAETSLRWHVRPSLKLYGSLGLLKTEVSSYPESGIEGNAFARAPAVTADVGFHWSGDSGFDAGANAHYSSAYWSSIKNRPRGRTDPYWLVNVRAGYRAGGLHTFVFVNNVFNQDTPLLIEPGATRAQDGAILPRPRNYGIGIQWNFAP